jgi:signal transduction histidine kinase
MMAIDDGRLMFAFAHDLRTHLRTVVISLQLLQRGGAATLPAEDQLMLKEAIAAAGHIDGLVNAMVSYCDPSAGNGEMNLGLVLRGILIERKSALADAGAQVEVSNDLDAPVPVALGSVLKELLTNACKFRDTNRPLVICIATRLQPDNTLEVVVSDNGLGVAKTYLERIFDPFQRLNSREQFPGYGLGLATCRRIAAVWGGTVAADSGEGGLSVRVTVPIDTRA